MTTDAHMSTPTPSPLQPPTPAPEPTAPTPTAPTHGIMDDFVFGGIESDDARLLEAERLRRLGLRHEYALAPLDPLPGQPVTLTVTVGTDAPVDQVVAYVTTDGSEPAGSRGVAATGEVVAFQRAGVVWEPLVWSYVEKWQATLPGQRAGTMVRYIIEGWLGDGPSRWSSEPAMDGTREPLTRYAFAVDTDSSPAWAREAVLYQLFVDRFRDHRRPLEAHVDMEPDALRTFWGGTLRGVIDALDYVAGLGVTVLWLTPIFATPTYHGYDTSDYYAVDPRFGTSEDLRELVQAAHARGLRVLLDLVVNHTSLDFAPFQAALADERAPERAWFSFGPQYPHGYRTFFGVRSMPQINLDHPAAREAICNVARYWLREFDVDGYRLDYAAGPSHAFWSAFRRACREVKPDCWLFGEVTRAGEALRSYTGRLDGCLDFAFAREVRRLLAQGESATSHFATWYERSRSFFGPDFSLPAFLDNHDMNRFLWAAGGDERKLAFGVALLMALGDAPILYYGTELGQGQPRAKGYHREESRHPMPWATAVEGNQMLAFTRNWIGTRKARAALVHGTPRTLLVDDAQAIWLLERVAGEERLLIAIHAGPDEVESPLPEAGPGAAGWRNLEGQEHRGKMVLAPWSVTLLEPIQEPLP
jgi:glycosidase